MPHGQFPPQEQRLEPAATLLLPSSEEHGIPVKTGRRLPGKGSKPSLATPVGSGMRELGQSQGRAPGWPLWLGADGEVVAAAAPSRDGQLPISPSQQQLLPHSPGCSCCRWGELPHSLVSAAENNCISPGEAQLQTALRQSSNRTDRFAMVRDENKIHLLELVLVSFASVR